MCRIPRAARNLVRESLQDLERGESPPCPNSQDFRSGPAPHLRHARCLRRTGHGSRGRRIRLDQSLEKRATRKNFKAISQTVREDGAYVEAGENDNLIVQKLEKPIPMHWVSSGSASWTRTRIKCRAPSSTASQPTFENIADGQYPVSRPLFFYVKKAHIGTIPGIEEYLKAFSAEKAWGPDGYLSEKGLIPMPDAERKKYAKDIKMLTPMGAK
jgi:hypothetical protein